MRCEITGSVSGATEDTCLLVVGHVAPDISKLICVSVFKRLDSPY